MRTIKLTPELSKKLEAAGVLDLQLSDSPSAIEMLAQLRHADSQASGLSHLSEGYIYSTGLIYPGAQGKLSLFTVPQGQAMQTLPFEGVTGPVLTEEHTNIKMAGEAGVLGAAVFTRIRAVSKLKSDVEARVTVRIAGMTDFTSPLAPLLRNDWQELKVPMLVARTDTLEVEIAFDQPTEHEKPAALRIELGGGFAHDVR